MSDYFIISLKHMVDDKGRLGRALARKVNNVSSSYVRKENFDSTLRYARRHYRNVALIQHILDDENGRQVVQEWVPEDSEL